MSSEIMQKRTQRKHKRFNVDCMDIQSKIILAKYIKLNDISMGGVSFETDKSLNIGNDYTLKIADKNSSLQVKGKVVWSTLHESVSDSRGDVIPIYRIGMEFLDMSDRQVQALAGFAQSHCTEKHIIDVVSLDDKRVHVRFLPDDPEKVSLDYASDFQLMNISLNGLLIESEQKITIGSIIPLVITFEEKEIIKLLGKVVRLSEKEDTPGHYDIGIEFMEMSETDKNILASFIESQSVKDLQIKDELSIHQDTH